MEDGLFGFFKRFIGSASPSGFEQPAQRVWREYVTPHVDRVETDVMGNTWGALEAKKGQRVMLAGHADEIGLMITYIDDQGFCSFEAIGGVDAHLLPGKRLFVHGHEGPVLGVIGRKPIHLLETEERTKVAKMKELFIDLGAADKASAEKLVAVGDPVTFVDGLERLQGDNVVGRGFDDKAGSLIVAEVLKRAGKKKKKLKCSVYGVSTVQEEVGLRGARACAFGIDPDIGICVEVTFASDHPGAEKKTVGDVALGKGPVLSRGANINHKLFKRLKEIAAKEKIPLQVEAAPRATGTDANVMQLNRSGVATALVQIPLRYMHTSGEVVNLADVENAIKLITAFLLSLDGKESWIPE